MPRVFIVILLALSLCACASSRGAVDWLDEDVQRVWPSPPDVPRIRLLRTINPSENLGKATRTSRFFNWLTGGTGGGRSMVSPYDVAADGRGRLWVSDPGLAIVHVVDLLDGEVSALLTADGLPLESPAGVFWSKTSSRLYVSDTLRRQVFVFGSDGDYVQTLEPPHGFQRPAGIARDAKGLLHVVDVLAGLVEVFDATGVYLFAYGGDLGELDALNRPTDIAIDQAGRVFISDGMNFRVVVFSPQLEPERVLGGLGDRPGYFARPKGVAVDADGHVYVADAAFDNVQVFDMAGNVLLFFGEPGSGPGSFNLPAGISFDSGGRLYVVDSHNRRVQVFEYLATPE